MFPLLIDLGTVKLPLVGEIHLALPTYGVLFALGALLAGFVFIRRARNLGIADDVLYNLSFYSLLAGILGAKLCLVLLDLPRYLADPSELLGTIRSAGVLIGGLIAGAVTFLLYARRHGLPVLLLGDAVAAPLALAQAIGRLGCFSAGCCWGVEAHADSPFAVTFTNVIAQEQTGVPLHRPLVPIQLVQMGNDLLLALVLTWLWRRRPEPPGTIFWIYVLLYSATRGTLEFWRGDSERGLYFNDLISTSQLLSVAGVIFALTMLLWRRPERRQHASA